tara:strand:- start:1675 stop:1782 length:108 start_codon:yes stop_codon:yes gene_type:complete
MSKMESKAGENFLKSNSPRREGKKGDFRERKRERE